MYVRRHQQYHPLPSTCMHSEPLRPCAKMPLQHLESTVWMSDNIGRSRVTWFVVAITNGLS